MMDKFFTVVSTLFVVQLLLYYHEVSAGSCRAIYGERFRCISPDACAQKNRVWKTRCGPKANGVCCQVMNEDHRNFKRCGIRVQRHAIHRHHPYGSSLKHFQPSSESMKTSEKINIPWVILANKGSDSGENWFQNDYIALSNSKQGFYRSRKNSNNQEENTDNDRYSVKNYVENSSATSRNSKLKIEVTNEIVEVSTKYDIQLNDTLYNNGESIKLTRDDLLQSTNACGSIGCSTNIIKSVVNDDVAEASNETSKKLEGSEETYFKMPTNSQISITENNKTLNPEDMNQFKNDNSFNETFEHVANSTETVTNTIVNQFSEESLKHSLGQENILNNNFDSITTDEEQFNNTNDEYNDNGTMTIIENATKPLDETSVVEAVESEEKGNLEDDSELLKIFSLENTVAIENENTSKLISESEQKTNLETFVEVTNENYSSEELKSEKAINTQNTFELSNESFSKLVSEYEETTNVQQTQYKEEFELDKKTHLDDSSELVTENSTEEKTVAGEEWFTDAIFPEEEENISIPYSEYEKNATSGVSIELLNESSLIQEFGLLNENSTILVSESKKNTNVQENAESTNGTHYKKEYQLKEKTNLEGGSEIVTESPLEESTISGENYFSEATTVEEKEENISKSDAEVKEKTISNIFTEMTNKNSFSQGSKSEETIHAESMFEFPNKNPSEFVLESENTTNVQETAETTNEAHYKEEHELEENTNLEGSSESMTESPLAESTTSGEDYFSEATTVKEKEGNISKSNSEAKEKTISNTSIEMTNETSFSQESKSEETIHAENTFEFPNENSSEFVSESEDTTNVQETAESTNKTHYKEEHELEEKTNLEGSSKSVTQSPLEESIISGEDYFSEATTVEEKEKSISKSDSEAKEKTISNIFTEMTNKNSFSQESKSEETIHAESTFEFPNENSSEFVLESENTTNVQETAETTNETHYKEEHELEENTNLEGSSESMTESPLAESTTSGEDYFSEATTVKEKEGNISKSNSEAKEKTISNTSIEMTNETSFSQESKSEETIHGENTFEFPNENSSEFVSESEDTTNVQETAESTNKTHYMEEHELEEKTNLEGSGESVTQSPLEESTISGEDYFSEVTTVEEKEKSISKSDSEAKDKIISNISTEITNSFSQESKSEETIKAENIFELPNENSSEFMSTFVESTNEAHYEEEVVKKTNLIDSRGIVTESSLEERAILGEKNFSETTAQAQSISKLESESESKTISEISVEMTNINSLSQESNSEEPANAQFTEISNEITSKLISESQEITSAKDIFESLNETNYEEDAGLEEKTNLEASGELVTENPSNEMTISKEEILYETTVDVENENVSKSVSESEGNKENSVEVSNENSLNKELKSENTSNVEINIELENANSSIFESETKETTSVQQTSGVSNETYFEGETKLEIYTNLEGSSKLVTENSLKENTISEEDILYETTIKAQKESIPKTSLSADITNSENFIEITKETSSNRESKSEETISTQTTFELPNENSSKSVSESEETTNMQENAAFINEKPYKHELELKEQTNLEGSSEFETENSLKKSTISEEDISSETIIKALNESISRNSLSAEMTNSENFVEITKETSSNRESKSVEAISTQNSFELSNGNSSKLVSESEETTNMQENAAFIKEKPYKHELDLKEQTNLEGSSKFVTENSLKESTISEKDISSETIIKALKESISKTSLSAEMTNSENFIEITKETSSNRESKSVETISTQNIFELSNGNSSKLVSKSDEITKMHENAAFTNETHYKDELQLKEKTNLEDSSELVTKNSLKESTISEEDIFSEPTVEVKKEKLTKTNSESEIKTISQVSIEMTNINPLNQESKSEELINAQITFELPNENYSKLMPDSEETTNVQKTAEFLNETNYEEEVDSEEKTNLESSSELTREIFLEERTISREEDIFETTVEAEKEYITKPDSKFEEETNSEKFVEIANENSSINEPKSKEKINSYNSFELQNGNASKLEFESEETTDVQESAKLTVESTTNLEGSNKLTNVSSVEEIKVEAENSNTSKEMSEFDEQSSSEVSVKVSRKSSSSQESESEETIYSQNTLELPNEDSSKLVSEAQETENVQETDDTTNETHYNEELELRKKTNILSSSELMTEKYLKQRTLSEEDFSQITVEAETKNILTEVSEIEQKTNIESFFDVTNENSSGQSSESEVTVSSLNAFELPIEGSSDVFVSEETTSIQETVEFTNEKKTNLDGNKLVNESSSEVEQENTETSKEVSQSEEKSNSKSFVKVTNENSSTQKPESEKSTKEQNTFEIANEDSLKKMFKPEKNENMQETYEFRNVTHYKPEFEEKTNFEDSNQLAYKSTFKDESTSGRDAFSGTTVEAENKSTSKGVFEYEEKTNSQIFAKIEKENSLTEKSESEETTNKKNNIGIGYENSSKIMHEFEETTNLQETVKSTVELEKGTLHKETSKPEQETDLKIISRVTNSNSYSVMLESKEAKLTEMTFGNEQNIIFTTSISAQKSIPETTATTVNEVVSVQMSKSEEETFTGSTFKQEHEKFYNGSPEIQVKGDGLSDERFYKNISESKKEEKLEKNTQQMNENLYKDVSEAVEESRISSKATMKDSNENFYKGTSASKKDSYQKNTTELPNENITDKTTILEENNNSESVTQIVNENISKEKNEAGEKTIWETIIESVTKMFSKQESESEKINLMSTIEMPNEGYSKTAYEYEEKANQLSTENFYKDVSEFKEDMDVVSSQKLTNEMYDMEVSEVKAKTTKADTVEINNKITSEEVNKYKEKINLQSTVGSAGEKSYTGVSAYEEKTNTEILDVAKEESDKKISELLLDVSPGIPTKVESEDYPKGTSEIEERINPLNNSENVFEGYTKDLSNHTQIRNLERKIELTTGNFYKESIASKEEANPITSSDLINEDIERGGLEVLVDASMKPAGEMANENIFTNKFETDVTINPLNNSEEAFEGIGMYHTEVSNLDSKIELTSRNSYNGSTEFEEETNPITSSDLMHEITKTEVPKILVDASMKTSREMANENIFTNKFETDETINPQNNSEETFEGIGMYHTEWSNLDSKIELTIGNSYNGSTESEEETNPITSSDLIHEITKTEVPKILVDASMKTSREMANENIFTNKFKTDKTINPLNNSEEAFEGIGMYHTEVSNLDSKIELTIGNSYNGSTESEEETNPITSSDLMHEITKTEVPKILVDASMKTSREMANENIFTNKFETDVTINPLNNSEEAFEGIGMNHTEVSNLDSKIELTIGNSYNGSTESDEETNPITSSDLMHEITKTEVPKILVDASMKTSGEMANENIFTNKFETDVTINPLNNSEEAFEGIGMYHTEVSNLDSKIELTIGNSYNGSTESDEETNPITSSDLMHEITKTEVPKILVDASMKTSREMANENIFTNKFKTDETINPLNNSEEAFEGIGMYHTEVSNLDSKIELTIGNSYNGSTESEEETNPITSSDLMHEITKTDVPKIQVDASMKTSGEMANENIFTNKFETDVTINPLNNSEEAFEGIGMYHTEVSNLDSKIELTIGNSYNGSTESEEETNPITSSDLMHEITKTEVPKILVDASMKTYREMANKNIFTNKFKTDETINPLNNSEEAFEGIGMYHTEVSDLDSKIELTIGNSYNGSTESEEETNPITSSDLMHEITKTEVPKILVDASMKTSREMANENIFTNKFKTDVTINPLNNSEEVFEGIGMYHTEVSNLDSKIELTSGNSYNGSTESEEETNPITSSDLIHEITKTEVPKILVDASMKTSREMANENIFTNKFETGVTINPLNNSEEAFKGIGMYHTEVSNLDSKIELTIGNSYNGSTESEEETNPITSSDLMHEITKTEVPKILVDASMKTSREMANENIFTNKFETDETINPLNNSEEAFEGIGMYHTEVSNLESKIELTIGNSYNGSTESEEETNPITSSDLMHEITKTEVPKILVDASMKTSREMANENIFTNKFQTDVTINPLNNSEEAFEGIGMYHTEVSNLDSKIELTTGNSYNGSTESEEETNPITSSDLMHEITKTEVPKILVDASMKTSREMANENIFTNKFKTDVTINPLNNSEEAFEGIGMYHTEVSNLDSKIELTSGNSYNGSTESEEETNPISSSDLMHEITKTEVPKILVDASMKTSREMANENIFTNKFQTDVTINPLNNSEEAFVGIGMYHTEVSNLDSKIELTIGNSYNLSTESEEETNPITSSDLMHEITKTEVPKILVDASMKTSREMVNENIFTNKFKTDETINPLNNSEEAFEGIGMYHTEVSNLDSKIELTIGNSYNGSTESEEETNPITSSDLMHEITTTEVPKILVDASVKTSREMANENIFTNKFETDVTINPLNNSEEAFEGIGMYHTEVSNLDSKIELTIGNSYNGSTESEEETNPITSSDLMHEITKTEVPKILVDASMKTSREMKNENISTDKFESEKTPNIINNSEMVFEDYSKNVFGHTKSTNVESNTELRKENSYNQITGSVQETNPNKSISNGITSHVMIEDEIWDKIYGTTTEEEIRLSNTDIKFYDGRENIHPGYTNEKEFHNSHTEISEYSTDNKNNLDIQIATSNSNKTSKTVTELNKNSNRSEILTKAPTHINRSDIVLEGDEENVPTIDLENLTNNSSTEIHESLENNTNVTMDKLLTEVSSENVLDVSDSFGLTTKYPNHFSNTEIQIYKSNDITTSQDFVVNENVSPYKETSKYIEKASDNSESIAEDHTQFSNAEISFQQSEANFTFQYAVKNEGVGVQMNSSTSYGSFSETSTNEISTNVSNENTRRTIEEYDTLDEEVADITTKDKKKFSNDEINFHENEKMTDSIFFETFITVINETSTEALEVLSKYFDISTENKIQITNPDNHLYTNVQNISIHKAPDLQEVMDEDRTESNNKNVSFLTSDNDFYKISDDFAKEDKTENESFIATTKSQFHFNNTETEFYGNKKITNKDTHFYVSELNSKVTTEFENINSFKNMSGDNKNFPENVTSPIFIDDSAGRFSHVIDGNKNSNTNFVISTEKQFPFNRTETELSENEERISPREVVEFESSSVNVEISNYETNTVKMIKNSSVDVDDDKYNTQNEAEAQFLNSSEDIGKGTLVKTKYTIDSLKKDFTSKYNTYSTFIEKKYHKYPDETIQQFMMKTTVVPPKPDHTDNLNVYKYDMDKTNTYHKDNTKLQPLENINKYYDYGGQSFNSIRQVARDEYHKAYFLSKMFENQPAFAQMFQHPMSYQNPNFMNERPINFPGPYYESNILQPYAQSYPYLYDQFNVNYPVSRFYQAGLFQQPLFSHNMVNPLPNNYRPYYGSENYQPSVQSYPSIYNKHDLGNMYPNKLVDFSTFHQKGFYRQPNPMYMIANPSLRRYRRSYGSESLQHSVQPNKSILKEYSLKKIEENQSTDLPKYHQVGLNKQLNPIYGVTESLLNKDNTYFRADSHPFFVKTHLNVLEPFEGKGQLDEFANKEDGIIQGKPEMSHFGTKNDPPRKQHIKKRKHYTKSKLRNGNRSLNSVVKKRGIELPAFTGNSNKFSNHKKDTFGMGRTEEPFRQAYREFIDRDNLLHVIEYLPPEKTYRKRIFNNETLDVTENKGIKHQTAHYSILDKILSTSTDYYKVPAGEKYFTNEYTVIKNEKYSKDKSEGDKLIEKSKIKGKRQKEELKPIKRNLNSVLISETQNTSQGLKNSNSYQENTLTSSLHENVTLFNDLDAVLNDVEFFPVRSEVQKTNVRRSNVPGISRKEANLQEGRTIGGKLEYENWPWIVSIYKLPDMFHVCSGTLIDDRHILTAAHCFLGHDYGEYVASVGSLLKISDPNQGYLVEDKILHTDFKKDCYCNDIALLRLKNPVDDHLTPICLSAIDTAVVGENTTLLGWGDIKFMAGRGKSGTDRLQRLNNLPITSSEECRKTYSRILDRDLSKNFSESYVCAGVPDGSKDACVGDSGGPLLHRSYDGSWTLLGVVSFGYKCGSPGVPGIYTRVSYYLEWIYGAIDKFNLSHLYDKPHSN